VSEPSPACFVRSSNCVIRMRDAGADRDIDAAADHLDDDVAITRDVRVGAITGQLAHVRLLSAVDGECVSRTCDLADNVAVSRRTNQDDLYAGPRPSPQKNGAAEIASTRNRRRCGDDNNAGQAAPRDSDVLKR
jgi:hypothetical protein